MVAVNLGETKMLEYIRAFADREVNVNDYTPRFVNNPDPALTKYNNLSFQKFSWEYIGDIDPNDRSTWPEGFDNEGIRSQQSSTMDKEELAYDFRINGWSTDFFPPIKKTNGEWEDGRTRILAARLNGEEYIPSALFHSTSLTPVSDAVANGLIANNHKKARPSGMADFVDGGIKAVSSGEVARTSDAIMNYLIVKAKIEQRFDNSSGIWTKIVNTIIERTSKEKDLVDNRDGDEWRTSFVANMPEYKGNPKSALILMANTGNSAWKYFFDHVLPNSGTPRPLILYTNNTSQARCSNDVQFFIDKVIELHKQTYSYVNEGVSTNTEMFSIRAPKILPFKILGVIPNFRTTLQENLLNEYKLISVERYIAAGSAISKKLKVVS